MGFLRSPSWSVSKPGARMPSLILCPMPMIWISGFPDSPFATWMSWLTSLEAWDGHEFQSSQRHGVIFSKMRCRELGTRNMFLPLALCCHHIVCVGWNVHENKEGKRWTSATCWASFLPWMQCSLFFFLTCGHRYIYRCSDHNIVFIVVLF